MTREQLRENRNAHAKMESAKSIFLAKLEELNLQQQDLDQRKKKMRDYALTVSDETTYQIVTRSSTTLFQKEEQIIKKQREKWNRLLNPMTDAQRKSFDLEALKQKIPIQDLMASSPKRSSVNRLNYVCPFHTEKTASFTVFLKDNTFHCFGCQAHGSLIDFVMRIEQLDFFKACQHINGL